MEGFDATNGVITIAPGVCEPMADEAIEWLFDLAETTGLYRRRQE
jgi:hypothetical protein